MSSSNFPTYHRLDALNSLVTKCVHMLCVAVNSPQYKKVSDLSLPSLYDFNLLTNYNKRVSSKVPCRFIELLYEKFFSITECENGTYKRSLLDINSRQSLIDYVIRERILVSANFVLQLLKDGGMYNLDLWQLCDINEFTTQEVELILIQMSNCAHVFRSLSIGGTNWIYNFRIASVALKKLLNKSGSLLSLKSLKLQQVSYEIEFLQILHSCPNLERLEIAQPSLDNRDILKVSAYLTCSSLPVCDSLRSVMLPSSVKEEGWMHFLSHFPNLTNVRCTPFEQLLDLLENHNLSPNQHLAQRALIVLGKVKSLSIAHPMSCDMVDRLLKVCPRVEELCLEVQEGMRLHKLITDAAHLRKLDLHNSPSMPLNFVEHVVPLLKGCGKHLQSLSLEYFDHIDLTTCAQYCPNLTTFSAQWFSTLTTQHRWHRLLQIKNPFSKLRHLRLRPRPHHSLSAEICTFLLNDALHLRHIELYCCSELTDETIEEINQKNSLSSLQTFIIRHGHNVTNQALCKLVSSASLTDNLVFHDCGLVPPVRKEDM